MTKRLTKETINERIANRGLRLAGQYSNKDTITTFECAHGHTWKASAGNVMRGTGCPYCSDRPPLDADKVNERLAERGIQLIGKYTSARTKTTFKCSQGHEWDATPDNVMRNHGCPYCANRPPLTRKDVNERLSNRRIVMIGDYVNANTVTAFRCEHGHEWETRPGDVMSGKGCPFCYGNHALTKEIINERLAHRGIKLIGEYRTNHFKTTFQCAEGHEWKADPAAVLSVSGCPECATSGIDLSKPGILYYLRIEDRNYTLWKIGITNTDVKRRFKGDLRKVTTIATWEYEQLKEGYDKEQSLLRKYSDSLYLGVDKLLSRGGNTELFVKDVLGLDKNYQ